jgi:hypothetical protein
VSVSSTSDQGVRPRAVDHAFALWLVAAAASLLSSVLVVTISLGSLVTTAFTVVITAVWVVMMFLMRGGSNVARIVLTVLGALDVLSTIADFGIVSGTFGAGLFSTLFALLNLVSAVAVVAAIVMMFKRESSAYFTAR